MHVLFRHKTPLAVNKGRITLGSKCLNPLSSQLFIYQNLIQYKLKIVLRCIQIDVLSASVCLMSFMHVRISLVLIIHESTPVSDVKTFKLCYTLKKKERKTFMASNL